MAFKLSVRSEQRLSEVKVSLQQIVRKAIKRTTVDFGVTEGLRTKATQAKYVAAGKSKTMNSKHLTGDAVDLVAYIEGKISWEITLYDNIAEAIRAAAKEKGVSIRWGAAWHIDDITKYEGTMQEATDEYVALRVSQGRRPFIDAPHFELS
jgi:peptidoglycan L-alanyl-D-glutamate endopeptidase CwlK